jgi:hypothetical protein
MNYRNILAALSVLAALPLAMHNAYGAAEEAVHAPEPMHIDANPKAPKMSARFFSSVAQVAMGCCAKARRVNR